MRADRSNRRGHPLNCSSQRQNRQPSYITLRKANNGTLQIQLCYFRTLIATQRSVPIAAATLLISTTIIYIKSFLIRNKTYTHTQRARATRSSRMLFYCWETALACLNSTIFVQQIRHVYTRKVIAVNLLCVCCCFYMHTIQL